VPKQSSTPRSAEPKHPIAAVPTLQARKQQLVRDAIWDAAVDLFTEKGFDETTVDDIAQAAGTSRRSFFRYFESKSDLLAQPLVSYGSSLANAIDSCPPSYALSEVVRHTVLNVARHSAAQPRARQIMEIVAKYPAAREAQVARFAEVQDRVAEAFARRCSKDSKGEVTAHLLAGLTLLILRVTFHAWFDRGLQDISIPAEEAFATLRHLACEGGTQDRRSYTKQATAERKQKRKAPALSRSRNKV
jgi:AcrR family transcriptional regulator